MKRIDAKKVAATRRAALLSQEELAIAATIDARTVQRAEAGKRISAETTKALAAVLGDQILTDTEEVAARRGSGWAAAYMFVGCTGGLFGGVVGLSYGFHASGTGHLLGTAGLCAGIVAAAMSIANGGKISQGARA